MSVGGAWRLVRDLFRRGGIDTPELDARLLAELAFGMSRLELANRERESVSSEALRRLQGFAERRLRGEPVARIVGSKAFWGLDFALNDATLVPRPETELLVERGRDLLGSRRRQFLDLGTGSGCIAVSLLVECPGATGIAIDLDPAAIRAAAANAERHGVAGRLQLLAGSWFDPLAADALFDLIVSNPPYIESDAIAGLAAEVKDHDPRRALDGGTDGLDAYRTILDGAPRRLRSGGALVVEIGAAQGPAVTGLFAAAGLRDIVVEKDLAGLDRMVLGHHF